MTKGTDSRKHDFFIIDNEVIDNYELGPYAGWLYIAIVRHINQQTGGAFPSIATLAQKTGMSSPTVIKYLGELEKKSLIRVKRQWDESTGGNKPNHYFLEGVVKEFNKGCKAPLQPLVKEVYTNKTNLNNTNEQEKDSAPLGAARSIHLPTALEKIIFHFYSHIETTPGIKNRNPSDRPVEKVDGRDLYFDSIARYIFEVDPILEPVKLGSIASRVGQIKKWALGDEIKQGKANKYPGCDLVVLPQDFKEFNEAWGKDTKPTDEPDISPGPAFFTMD
jgi:DNA-binding transcriptional regulator YhcF (GntR family)